MKYSSLELEDVDAVTSSPETEESTADDTWTPPSSKGYQTQRRAYDNEAVRIQRQERRLIMASMAGFLMLVAALTWQGAILETGLDWIESDANQTDTSNSALRGSNTPGEEDVFEDDFYQNNDDAVEPEYFDIEELNQRYNDQYNDPNTDDQYFVDPCKLYAKNCQQQAEAEQQSQSLDRVSSEPLDTSSSDESDDKEDFWKEQQESLEEQHFEMDKEIGAIEAKQHGDQNSLQEASSLADTSRMEENRNDGE